uniref:Uncharacterized protein n=1 Tax=Anguilla anguilla TaxID=7936 RepID=A0A0E9QRC0_ANGAN
MLQLFPDLFKDIKAQLLDDRGAQNNSLINTNSLQKTGQHF